MRNPPNIVLVGPMGAGKSSIGRLLAARLGLAFIDLDSCIEQDAALAISSIFTTEGEAGFRARESRLLCEVLARSGQLVATGGGAVLDAGNRAVMQASATVIYLSVDLAAQLRRVDGDGKRPLLAGVDPTTRLAELQALREPLYREIATLVFDTSAHTPDTASAALAQRLQDDMGHCA